MFIELVLVAVGYHIIAVPFTAKSPIDLSSQNSWLPVPVGAGVFLTVIVMLFLQVLPLVVTYTQYVVVTKGFGLMDAVVSPVDHK